jgi:hypothetical protein
MVKAAEDRPFGDLANPLNGTADRHILAEGDVVNVSTLQRSNGVVVAQAIQRVLLAGAIVRELDMLGRAISQGRRD